MSSKERERDAGLLERYHITRQYLKLDSCVIVAGRYYSSAGIKLTPSIFYPALARTVRTHAALCARIVDERGSGPSFGYLSNINLEDVVRFLEKDDRTLTEIMEAEFMNPIDAATDLPLWRFTITSDNVVIFSWHHAIGDGQSGLAVLRTLLNALNATGIASIDDADFRSLKVSSDLRILPPLEEMTDLSVSFKTLATALFNVFVPQSLTKRKVWTGNKVVKSTVDATKTYVRILAIPPSSATQLLSLAKSHGTTLTAALHTLSVATLSRLVIAQPWNTKFKRISTSVAVSLRPLTKTPMNAMCEVVSTFRTYERISSKFSWEKAGPYAQKLHKAIPKTREVIGSIKYLFGHYEEYFKGKLGSKREGTFEISNVGLFKLDIDSKNDQVNGKTGEWTIGDAYFAQDDGIFGSALKINVVGSPNGGLVICVTWGEGSLDNQLAETFVTDFDVAIKGLLDGSHGK